MRETYELIHVYAGGATDAKQPINDIRTNNRLQHCGVNVVG